MPRYTATWGLNLLPDPAEEEHESIYECAPTKIEGKNFSAAAKVEQMAELDAQMPVPMDDKAGWTVRIPMGVEFPKECGAPHHRDDPHNQAEPSLFALLRINLIPDTDALKAAEERHFAINELRADYAELLRAWKHRESTPIDSLVCKYNGQAANSMRSATCPFLFSAGVLSHQRSRQQRRPNGRRPERACAV